MGNRLYVAGIVLFWLAAMTWLVAEKVLPSFFTGEAPLTGTLRQEEPVAWRIDFDGVACGEAVLQSVDGGQGVSEVHSHVRIDHLPRPAALPLWLQPMAEAVELLSLETRTRTAFDGFGRLARFETRIQLNKLEFPIRVTGAVAEQKLRLLLRAGEIKRQVDHPWPADGVLAHEMVPETKLLDVYPGKRWRREVYSPFVGVGQPVEVLEAVVVDSVKINYQGEVVPARLVEYRSPNRTGASDAERLRAKIWVAEDGRVLKQETYLFGSRLAFMRLDAAASRVAADERLQLSRHASMRTPTGAPQEEQPPKNAGAEVL